jgi:hypothetical protein
MITYDLENRNVPMLFQSIIKNLDFISKDEVIEYCWGILVKSDTDTLYLKLLKKFLIDMAKKITRIVKN